MSLHPTPLAAVLASAIAALAVSAAAAPIDTHSASLANPTAWLKASRVSRAIDAMESKLEWDIRKIQVSWHPDAAEFKQHKGAVPQWLEEGLANFTAKQGKVDYAWLAAQPSRDAYRLAHPFAGLAGSSKYHYQASQALMEMIASKCPPQDLLQLSVGKKLESYLPTLCGIQDLNADFKAWIARKAKATATAPR